MESNKLFYVQDADRSMYVLAPNWTEALRKWKELIVMENPEEDCSDEDPDGISLVVNANELIV